jgi:hypothetical protein
MLRLADIDNGDSMTPSDFCSPPGIRVGQIQY